MSTPEEYLFGCIVRLFAVQLARKDFGGFMMPGESGRTSRIEARISPDALRVVKRAAELQGRSVSDFVVSAAQEAAGRVIEDSHLIRLSVEDQQRFAEVLLNPPEPSQALKRAKEAHEQLVREQ